MDSLPAERELIIRLALVDAAPKPDYPDITPDDLKALDGFIFVRPGPLSRPAPPLHL